MTSRGDTAARELGLFLRRRREELTPERATSRRRTPGLRREEVAERARVSVDYVIRLEQGRGLHPSPEVVEALCTALELSGDERAYVAELARRPGPSVADPGPDDEPARTSPAARLVHDLSPLPAMLIDHRLDLHAWNPEVAALLTDFGAVAPERRNSMELCLFELADGLYVDRDDVLAEGVADLRAAWAAYPDDARLGTLIEGWCARSPEFARCWERRDVRVAGRGVKRLRHPVVGRLDVAFEVLHPMADPHERLVIYRGADAASRQALDRLTAGSRVAG